MIDFTGLDHETYIEKNAPCLWDEMAIFRDREFGDIKGIYEGEFTRDERKESRYSVEWNVGVRYSYTATEDECIAYIEGYMDGYHEGRK